MVFINDLLKYFMNYVHRVVGSKIHEQLEQIIYELSGFHRDWALGTSTFF